MTATNITHSTPKTNAKAFPLRASPEARRKAGFLKIMAKKTANIVVYHVFGTKGTVAARIEYRGKFIHGIMENASPQTILDKARDWAHSNGFTHCNVTYG